MIVFLTFLACIVSIVVILYLVNVGSKMISDVLRIRLAKSKIEKYNKINKNVKRNFKK